MTKRNLLITLGLLLAITAFLGIRSALAKPEPAPAQQTSPLHPTFALLDKNGENVLKSGNAVSTMQTCGQCHDTEFIQSHAFHSDLGLSDYNAGWRAQLQHWHLREMGSAHLSLSLPAGRRTPRSLHRRMARAERQPRRRRRTCHHIRDGKPLTDLNADADKSGNQPS